MATKSAQHEGAEKVDVEELLDYIDKTMERLKTLYEQYFLGMQKQAPSHIHNDIERRIRDLMQVQIRNTGLRYRFATLQQKFGSYNSYWRRTMRQIEQGTYIRQLQRIGRKAAQSGEEIPEEILAAMPKRMREQVKRDREQALAIAARRRVDGTESDLTADDILEEDDAPAMIGEPEMVRNAVRKNQHQLSEADADLDIDAFFASVSDDTNPDAKPYVEKKPAFIEAKTQADPVPPVAARPQPAPPQRQSQPVFSLPEDEDEATSFSAGPPVFAPPHRASQPIPTQRPSGQVPVIPPQQRPSQPIPTQRPSGQVPVIPPQRPTPPPMPGQQARPSQPIPTQRATGPVPAIPPQRPTPAPPPQQAAAKFIQPNRAGTVPGVVPASRDTGPIPVVTSNTGPNPVVPRPAPSQVSRPNPIQPGSSQTRAPSQVESMQGPFPRAPAQQPQQPPARHPQQGPRPVAPQPPMRPPPGMNDADVNALYAKYVKAKQAVGDDPGPGAYGKLLKTINAQAPKIMEQYKAKGVEFSVVVKDNQVIIKAKPKP